MPNLAAADDRTFVVTMQRFNENPAFFLTFAGALVLTALAAVLQRRHGPAVTTRWTVAALVLYAVVLAVTLAINVTLRGELDWAGTSASTRPSPASTPRKACAANGMLPAKPGIDAEAVDLGGNHGMH